MITKEHPGTFTPEIEEQDAINITFPADLVRRLRATSYAVGGLTVSQIVTAMLDGLGPEELVDALRNAYEWTDPAEQRRLKEASTIASQSGDDWESFCEGAAKMQPF